MGICRQELDEDLLLLLLRHILQLLGFSAVNYVALRHISFLDRKASVLLRPVPTLAPSPTPVSIKPVLKFSFAVWHIRPLSPECRSYGTNSRRQSLTAFNFFSEFEFEILKLN